MKLKQLMAAALCAAQFTAGAAMDAVQLWEGGPYFAICNVGATKPEEPGYYFWWGDTVGYTNSGSAWVSSKDGTTPIEFSYDKSPANTTKDKTIEQLYNGGNGWIDANSTDGKLKPEYDAATAHLGAPWRMMTKAELDKLVDTSYCTRTWVTSYKGKSVNGYVVKGANDPYKSNEVFFPAAGCGEDSSLKYSGVYGYYWSSAPVPNGNAYCFSLSSGTYSVFTVGEHGRFDGHSVRPVRDTPPDKAYDALKQAFDDGKTVVEAVTNASGAVIGHTVILGANYVSGVKVPTDLGTVTLDLNGWTIRGTNGVNGTKTTAGGNGGAAITIAGTCGAAAGTTAVTVINNGATDGVQLWEGGPYFAECNVGANAPHEYGYYFWWGDTVGYTNRGSAWVSADGKGKTIKFSSTDTTANQTYGKDDDTLKSEGWIDESGNLVAAHDAATAHLGAPWRMMTDAELKMLVDEDVCQCTWTGNWEGTGKKGYVIKGKTAGYTDKSVFFPAAGCGEGSNLSDAGRCGLYWSLQRSDNPNYPNFAWYLWFDWEDFMRLNSDRYYGLSVRPVRGFDAGRPAVGPSAAIVGGNGGDGNPAGKGAPAIVDESGAAVAVTDPKGLVKDGTNGTGGTGGNVLIALPTGLAGCEYAVSNLTAGAEIEPAETLVGSKKYALPLGAKVAIYCVPAEGYVVTGTNPYVVDEVTAGTTVAAEDLPKAVAVTPDPPPQPVAEVFRLYPAGDGGVFVPAVKSVDTYNGTIISDNGVEGTIQVKAKKPNKKTGLFDIQAKVVTLVDKATYSFKAKGLSVPTNGVLTAELPSSNGKSAGHKLVVTLDGDSLTGAFDSFRIDGARDVFALKDAAKMAAVKPFADTYWTGVFGDGASNDLFVAGFSVTIKSKNGKASVKVLDADGKSMSCNAVCEVGANGVVAVPVTVRKSVKTAAGSVQRSFGFRIAFNANGVASCCTPEGVVFPCAAVDVSPVRDWVKKTSPDKAAVYSPVGFVAADALAVTPKAFKDGYVTAFAASLTNEVGSVVKTSLKLAKTGFITGSVTVDVAATGKSATCKSAGVVVGTSGMGAVNVKLSKDLTVRYGFESNPAK